MLQENFDGKKSCSKMAKFLHKLWLFFLSNNGIHYFLFLSFYIGTKTKKEKYSCMSADIIAFLFARLSHTLYKCYWVASLQVLQVSRRLMIMLIMPTLTCTNSIHLTLLDTPFSEIASSYTLLGYDIHRTRHVAWWKLVTGSCLICGKTCS